METGESMRYACQSFHLAAVRKRSIIYEYVALHSCGEAHSEPQFFVQYGHLATTVAAVFFF